MAATGAGDWIQTSPGCDINRRGRVKGEEVVVKEGIIQKAHGQTQPGPFLGGHVQSI